MGLCASSPKEEPNKEQPQQQQSSPSAPSQASQAQPAAAPASSAAQAKPNVKLTSTSAPSQSPIDIAIAAARKELEKNKGINFEDRYTSSKLIGHGAFAKVSICEHNETKAQFAAKVVTKSVEDPEKQREGMGRLRVSGVERPCSHAAMRSCSHAQCDCLHHRHCIQAL